MVRILYEGFISVKILPRPVIFKGGQMLVKMLSLKEPKGPRQVTFKPRLLDED